MPEKNQTVAVSGYDAATLTALAYGTLESLQWNIKYAGENILVAYTPRSAFKWDMEITVQATENNLDVSSKMIHGEAFDLSGRNQKNINQFIAAFEPVKQKADEQVIQSWNEKINTLMQETMKVAAQEVKQAQETDKVMNFSSGNMNATYTIIGINVLMFVIMAVNGAGIFDPNGAVHVKWGSNYTDLTLSGDWWRLLTCTFIHFGIIHLALNMYALFNIGMFLEPMLGKTKFVVAYLCTGVLASVTSLWWHSDGVNSAGASGAIFGLIGLLLAFIVTKYIPSTIRKGLMQSVGLMAVYSLIYGLKGGVDNAAHIGGLVSGFIIGYIYWFTLKQKEKSKNKIIVIAGTALFTLAVAGWYITSNAVGKELRKKALNELSVFSAKDGDVYYEKYNQFVELQDKALAPFSNSVNFIDSGSSALMKTNWEKAEKLLLQMEKLDVSENQHRQTRLLKEYVQLRKQELEARLELQQNPSAPQSNKLEEIINAIDKTTEEFKKLQSPD